MSCITHNRTDTGNLRHYNYKLPEGDNAYACNALSWDFFPRHRDVLQVDPWLGMVCRQLEKMEKPILDIIRTQAMSSRTRLDSR